jgi:hypothetical protein
VQVWVKCERPACRPGVFFSYYFYFNGLSETKMPNLADLFFGCKGFGLCGFGELILGFGGFWGLTCDFWAENAKQRQSVASPFGLRFSLRQCGARWTRHSVMGVGWESSRR